MAECGIYVGRSGRANGRRIATRRANQPDLGQYLPTFRRARINLVFPAGEIPAPLRGGAASPGIESWAREVTNRTKRRQSDERAVTEVKLLSLVKYLTAGRQYRSGWQAPVGTPQMARWPETAAGSGSTARSETEALRDLGDPLWSWSASKQIEYAGRWDYSRERQMLQCEVGFAGSTPSAGKPRTWGSGETDED